jgi:heme/copper-type cytochrome/quinol oxidase subunit 2
MDLFSFLATIILITSIVSLVMAIAAYIAYKIRDIRKPRKNMEMNAVKKNEVIFLSPVNMESIITEWKERELHPRPVQHAQVT